uniref:Reverse transcriptase domain-containing protein n=1 Tax=Tanacetum cinerariifolium TaxID=118510 RepID=A0A699S9R4_TANCI|nr:reverse transcriptase domain-containing protein [Tanacetum cinerariifolium]
MREIHEGSCSMHAGPRSVVAKAVRLGTEAVIPAEIRMPTYRTAAVDVVNNDKELRLNLDLLEEPQERAAVCEAKPNQR